MKNKKHIFQMIEGLELVVNNPKNSLEEVIEQLTKEGFIILNVKKQRIAFRSEVVIMVIEESGKSE